MLKPETYKSSSPHQSLCTHFPTSFFQLNYIAQPSPALATMPQQEVLRWWPAPNGGWTQHPPHLKKKNTSSTSKNPTSTKPVKISVKDSEKGHRFDYSGPANSTFTTQALKISKKMLAQK